MAVADVTGAKRTVADTVVRLGHLGAPAYDAAAFGYACAHGTSN
jgi:hypothetical protein